MDPNIDNHHQRRHYHHRHHKIALLPMLFGLQPLPRSTQQAPATLDRFGRPCFRLGIMEQKGAALQTKVDERDPPPAKRRREVCSIFGHRSVCTCRCSSGGRRIPLDPTHTPPDEQMVLCARRKCSDDTGKHQPCQVKVWALCRLLTGGLCGDCRDNGPPTASSLVPNMSAKKKMGRVARGQPFDNFGKCTAEGFVIYNEIKAIVKSNQSLLQPRHTLRQGRVAKPT